MAPDDSDSSVTLLFRSVPARIRFSPAEKSALTHFAQLLSARVGSGRPFTVVFSNDAELRRLNRTFLAHDYPTDVLSFPTTGSSELGEIAISVERAKAQAEEFGHSLIDEARTLMLHGVLHLSGLDHERDNGRMARAESKWRAEFALPITLIARSSRRPEAANV